MADPLCDRSFCLVLGIGTAAFRPGGWLRAIPALSPWLMLNQRQGGPVDNYHMFVQPTLQLQGTLQGQQMGIQQNAAGLNAMGDREMTQTQANYAAIQPTGLMAAGFLTHHIYFNTNRATGTGTIGPIGAGASCGGMYLGELAAGSAELAAWAGLGSAGLDSAASAGPGSVGMAAPGIGGIGRGL